MRRTSLDKLSKWAVSKGRKPLILKGARQVGKTYLLNELGKQCFARSHYLNFEKNRQLKGLFEADLDPKRIIKELELYLSTTIDLREDLVIFDEIQACPNALTSLKYFQEELAELALVSAGSLLGIHLGIASFPVGKVDMMTLYPMSFEEFLQALGEEKLYIFLNELNLLEAIPEFVHERLWELLKLYFIVGGMPEAVATFARYSQSLVKAFSEVRVKQEEIISAYLADMAKHSGKVNAMQIERTFRSVPTQMGKSQSGNVSKFIFKGVVPGIDRYSRLAGAIDWLEACGLLHKVPICNRAEFPLLSFSKENEFKLFLSDVGLLGAMTALPPEAIYRYEYGTFKGYFAENFVAQELLYSDEKQLYAWHEKRSELEFLLPVGNSLIPIEVKSGWVTKAKSLLVYKEKYHPEWSCIMSAHNLRVNEEKKTVRIPLYLSFAIKRLLLERRSTGP